MNPEYLLPFKVGDQAESKSFERGYRGAWFRCKIEDMGDNKRGKFAYLLEFFDYPADKPRWTQLYKKLPYRPKSPQALIQLMVRPSYPTVYLESEAPHPSTISDVIVVVHGTWKVGDLVDWWYEGCYWSGSISQVYEDGNYQVHLLEPPNGEGKSYRVDVTSLLRPSLDWCPELGWTIPHSERKGTHHASVRLVHPCDRDVQQSKSSLIDNSRSLASSEMGSSISSNRSPSCFSSLDDREEIEKVLEPDDSQEALRCLEDIEQATESVVSGVSLPAEMETGKLNSVISSCKRPRDTILIVDNDERDSNYNKLRKLSGRAPRIEENTVSPDYQVEHLVTVEREIGKKNPVFSSRKRESETTPIANSGERDSSSIKVGRLSGSSLHDSGISPKKPHTGQSDHLSKKLQFDAIELSIIELEELANKIKWLQGTVKYGMNWSPEMKPSWNFSKPG